MPHYDDAGSAERRRSLLVLLAVVAVAGALAWHAFGRSDDPPPKRPSATAAAIDFPEQVAGYRLAADAQAEQIASSLRSQRNSPLDKAAKVAVYDDVSTASDGIAVLAVSARDSADVADQLTREQPSTVLRDVLTDVGAIGGKTYPTGTRDGVEECATYPQGDSSLEMCVWVGASTVGITFDLGRPARSQEQLATLTARIRAGSEH